MAAYSQTDDCPPENYKPWLARIATNKARDHLKSAWNRRVSAPATSHAGNAQVSGAPPETPEDLTVSEAEAEAIRRMVRELKEPCHRFRAVLLEERSVENQPGAAPPPKTVHTQLFRAKRCCSKNMERERRR